ncbi:response regulator [Rheinheimera maricola]|uniref:Response regulator n=1 Tax=Rheinheimera maricola TaxID=2793282 RepID=A0ABS7XCG7_9GAMM|nr:response regulator [Rheinheimera maricola]MBZ9613041.1 response regulator [Rheinheimera maricola]
MTTSLLLIDDDYELTELLTDFLTPQGYQLTIAHDGQQGLEMATSSQHFNLILLDVMLPKLDGFEVLKQLRRTHMTPVIMLTAKGDDFDRIFGLELGADDYLPKPFNPRELSARIKAIVRRLEQLPTLTQSQPIRVNDLYLDPSAQQAKLADTMLILTGTEFSMLQLLMAHAGQLVSKEQLSEKVLGRKLTPFDRSIDMHVSNVRRKLADIQPQDIIRTIRGSGYILVKQA